MNIDTMILIILLAVSIFSFVTVYVLLNGLKFNAGYVFGFTIFFDIFGFFYKQVIPGNSLILLIIVPLIPVLIAWLQKPSILVEMLDDVGIRMWMLFLGYSVISLVWAASDSQGLTKAIILLVHGVIPGIYIYIIFRKYKQFSWTIVALFGLAYAIVHLTFGQYMSDFPDRLTLPGGNPIFNARMSLITVTVCLWARPIPLLIRVIPMLVAMISALFTQSRGPVAAFLIANVLILLFVAYKKYRKGELKYLSKYAVVALFVLTLILASGVMYFGDIKSSVSESRFLVLFDKDQLQADDNYVGRVDLQRKTFERIEYSPFFGVGLGGNTPPLARDFPHNVVLEVASELGFFGLSLWLIAFLYCLYAARYQTTLLVLLIQTLGYALISGDFGYNFEYIVVAFAVLACTPHRMKRGES